MKRILSLTLVLILTLSCFTACGEKKETQKKPASLPALKGSVTIQGEGVEDTVLTATTDVKNPVFRWYMDGSPIANSNTATLYVPINGAGKSITVQVTAEGYTGAVESNAITATANSSNYRSMAGVFYASKISGRVFLDPQTPTAARIEWPACGFEFKVNAQGGPMRVHYETTYESTLAVFVDGEKQTRPLLMPVAGGFYFDIELTAGEHTIKLLRELEPNTYINQKQMLKGIEFAGTFLDKPADNDLFIEFIGESTVTGSGSAGTFRPGAGFLTTDHSNTSSFAYQTAQMLHADYSLVAKGNMGFLNGDVGQNFNMPFVYDYQWRWSDETPYTYERTPDVIIMKIGMNDTVAAGHTLEGFKEGAKDFIAHLRELHGKDVPIVWFDRTNTGYPEEQYNAMLDLQKELKDENFYVTRFDWGLDGAGPATSQVGLASAANHTDIANQLVAYLKENNIVK